MGAAAVPIAIAMQAAGPIMAGIEDNRANRAQARIDDENARLTVFQGEQQVLQSRKDERMSAGDMLAAMGGSGVELGSGSAFDMLAESAYQRELEMLNVRTQAGREAEDLRRQANERRKAGKAALIQGVFGAASSVLQGVSNMRAQRTAAGQAQREGAARRAPPMRLATGAG